MSRPPLEMADIVRCAGHAFLEPAVSGSTGNTEKCCWPSRAVAPPRWADIAIAVPAADIRPGSRTTPAETGIAHGARATRACAGSRRVNENCCPPAMSMPSSLCRGNWPRSLYRTSGSSITCSFTPVPRRCVRLLATLDILEPRSVSSACSTPGISDCSFIPISTVSLPPAASHQISQMDLRPAFLLPAHRRAQPCLPRQVRRRTP